MYLSTLSVHLSTSQELDVSEAQLDTEEGVNNLVRIGSTEHVSFFAPTFSSSNFHKSSLSFKNIYKENR